MSKKALNYITFVSFGIFAILFTLLVINLILNLPYEIRSNSLFFFYYKCTPIFLFIACFGFLIKSILAKSKPWTKWLSVILFSAFTFIVGIRFVILGGSLITKERLVVFILAIIGAALIIATVLIKKYTVTRWIAFSIFLLLSAFTGILSFFALNQPNPAIKYTDAYTIYQSLDNKKFKVIQQTSNYGYTRMQLIKNSKLHIRYSKLFLQDEMNGRWMGYDEFGNVITINTYKDGIVIAREPVLPENAELVGDVDSLFLAFSTPADNRYLCLEGSFFIERPLKINGAKNITLTKPLNVENPVINSNYDSHYALVFENCENIVLDSLSLNLSSNYAQEPGIINIINCSNIMIKNCNIAGNAKYAIFIDKNSSDIIIKNNTFSGYKNFGIFLSTENTTLNDNAFTRLDNPDYITDIKVPAVKLTQDEILQLIKISIENKEDYPFAQAEPNFKMGETTLTTFLGSPNDLYYYGGLYEALDNYFSFRFGSDCGCILSYCSNVLYKITGVPVFITDVSQIKDKWGIYEGEPRFNHLNPEFIDWIRNNMFISPERKAGGIKLQDLYDEVFYHFFRLLTESYLFLHNNYNIDEEITMYKNYADGYNLQYQLNQRYNGILNDYDVEQFMPNGEEGNNPNGEYTEQGYEEAEGYAGEGEANEDGYEGEYEYYEEEAGSYYDDTPFYMEQPECMGFWLRRCIDGSADKLFDLLAEFMETYDTQWFEEISIKYGYSRY